MGKQESRTLVLDGAGVDAVPNANLNFRNLTMAYLIGTDLTSSSFQSNTLTDADFSFANLTNVNFDDAMLPDAILSRSNLTNASFDNATLAHVDLSDADVRGTIFDKTTSKGFTASQLYSTASYQAHDLTEISLYDNDLSDWNFAGQNLTKAVFFFSTLTDVDLKGAEIRETSFGNTTLRGFTASQLYSTVSYQAQDLDGIDLRFNNLSGWDLSGQNLIDANFILAKPINGNLSQANLTK